MQMQATSGLPEMSLLVGFACTIIFWQYRAYSLTVRPANASVTGLQIQILQISLDIRDSLLISHLVRKPVRKQTNMMVKTLFSELPSSMIRPELKTR